MEMLGERSVWSMSDSEKLSTLDAVVAECARLETIGLHLIADLDQSGYAKDLGAADTAQLLSLRYLVDITKARRDVRVATALAKHPATAAALPDPATPFPHRATHTGASNDAPSADEAGGERQAIGGEGWRVDPAQAEAIVAILAKVPAAVAAEDVEFAERQLIGLAATHTPSQLRQAGRQIRAILDPDGPEPDETKAYAREALTLKPAEQGVTFRGYLANENAELFRTLIHAGSKPHKTRDGEHDPRPRAKRQADALTTVLNTAATAHHLTGPGRMPRASGTTGSPDDPIGVTAGQDPLPGTSQPTTGPDQSTATDRPTGVGEPADNDPSSGPGQDAGTGVDPSDASHGGGDGGNGAAGGDAAAGGGGFVPGYGPKAHISVTIDFNDLKAAAATATGALVFGDDLSAATIRRLACDADILPIVLGSKSQPLDVGTSQRLATRAIRRALNARDKGCVICAAPPIQCEAHHLTHWIDGGPTAVSNMVLLCKRHHIDLHAGHWHIQITDGVVQVTRPTWADPTRIPHGRYRPPTTPIRPPPTTSHIRPPGSPPHARPHPADPQPAANNTDAAAVCLNPWGGDAAGGSPPRDPAAADATSLNPWGDDPEPAPWSTDLPPPPMTPTYLDPWGDGSTSEPSPSANNPARIPPGCRTQIRQ